MKKNIAFSILFWMMAGALKADTLLTPGETGSGFLLMPISARSVALGSGLSGLAGEIHGVEFNPAVLSSLRNYQLTFTRSQLYQDTNFTSFGLALKPINNFGFGLQYRRFGVTDVARDASGYETGEDVKIHDNGFQVGTSYSFFKKRVSVGYSIEYIRRFIYRYTAITTAHNMGLLFDFFKGKHVLGISLQNVGQPVTFIQKEEPLPIVFRLGGSHKFGERLYDFIGESDTFSQPVVLGVWELSQYRDSKKAGGSAGLEWRPFDLLKFRAGVQYHNELTLASGLGFQWKSLELDYSMQSRSEIGLAHTVSLLVKWGTIDLDLDD